MGSASVGSSPPARGTRPLRDRSQRDYRFIPACAGNTAGRRPADGWRSVHPRLRGEHFGSMAPLAMGCGSSPPARGTHLSPFPAAGSLRFIPACAGNTAPCRSIWPRPPVHPRLRGEHGIDDEIWMQRAGSSPPARGTLFTESVVPQSFLQCQKTHRPIGTPVFQFRSPPCTRATQRFRGRSPAVRGCGGRRSGKRGSTRRRLPSSQSERRRLCRSQARSRIASI